MLYRLPLVARIGGALVTALVAWAVIAATESSPVRSHYAVAPVRVLVGPAVATPCGTVCVRPSVGRSPLPGANPSPSPTLSHRRAPASASHAVRVAPRRVTSWPGARGHKIVRVPTCSGCATVYEDRTEMGQSVSVTDSRGRVWTTTVGDLALIGCNNSRSLCRVRSMSSGRVGTADGDAIYARG